MSAETKPSGNPEPKATEGPQKETKPAVFSEILERLESESRKNTATELSQDLVNAMGFPDGYRLANRQAILKSGDGTEVHAFGFSLLNKDDLLLLQIIKDSTKVYLMNPSGKLKRAVDRAPSGAISIVPNQEAQADFREELNSWIEYAAERLAPAPNKK